MADAPIYQQTEEYRPGSGPDLTSKYAAEEQVTGQIERQAFGIAQKSADQAAAQQGAKDAMEQGKDFRDSWGLTEAGQAYNRSGNPVAEHIATTQIAGQFQQYYNQEIQNGITSGSQASLLAQMQSYASNTVSSSDPAVREAVQLKAQDLAAAYSSKLANKYMAIQQAQGQIAMDTDAKNNAGSATSLAFDAGFAALDPNSPNPAAKASRDSMNRALATYYTQVQHGTMTAVQYEAAKDQLTKDHQESAFLGQTNSLIQNYNWAVQNNVDPAKQAVILEQLNKFPETALSNQNLTGLNETQRQTLMNKAHAMIKNLNTSIVTSSKLLTAQTATGQDDALHGRANPNWSKVVQSNMVKDPTFTTQIIIPQHNLNLAAYAQSQQVTSGSVSGMKAYVSKGGTPIGDSSMPGDMRAKAQAAAVSLVQKQLKMWQTDPVMAVQGSTSYGDEAKEQATQLATADDRVAFNNLVMNPSALLTQRVSPEIASAYAHMSDYTTQQARVKGLQESSLEGFSKADARVAASELMAAPEDQKQQMLSTLLQNTGKNFGLYQRSLYRAGVPAEEFLHHQLMTSGANRSKLDDLMRAGSMVRSQAYVDKDAKSQNDLYGTIGIKKQDLMTQIMSSSDGDTIRNFMSTVRADPEHLDAGNMYSSSITDYVAYKMLTDGTRGTGTKNNPNISSYVKDATDLVLGTQYQSYKDGVRVPNTVAVPTGSNQMSRQPIDLSRVRAFQDFFSKNVMDKGDVSAAVDAYQKRFPGAPKDLVTDYHKSDLLGNAHWRTYSDDSGLYMVTPNGHMITNKDTGRAYGFRFSDTLPGSGKQLPLTRLELANVQLQTALEKAKGN